MPNQEKQLFTPAQLEALSKACKTAAFGYGWDGSNDADNRPGLQTRNVYSRSRAQCVAAPEPSILSIARRGGADRFQTSRPWPTTYWLLTPAGIQAGLKEYKRREGKDLLKEAAKEQAKHKKMVQREERIVKAIAKPFRGMNVRIGEGKKRRAKDLGVHIEKTLLGKGTATTVDMDRDLLEQLGKSIDALRSRK